MKNKLYSENIEEMTLAEALGYISARSVVSSRHKIILPKGAKIDPRAIGRLATQGIEKVCVYRKPRISVIVVGNGLAERALDFTSAALRAVLETMRIRPVFVRRIRGEDKVLRQVVPFAFRQSDIVILVAKETEPSLTKIKAAAGSSTKPIFCLPDDPDQFFDVFYKFIEPAIQVFMGFPAAPGR